MYAAKTTLSALICSLFLLAGCGGGGSPVEPLPPPPPPPPKPTLSCLVPADACEVEVGSFIEDRFREDERFKYYTFTTTTDGVVELDLYPVPDDQELGLTLLADDETTRLADVGATQVGQRVLTSQIIEAGRYIVQVDPSYNQDGSEKPFTLNVKLNTSDPREVNNAFSTATPLELNQKLETYLYGRYTVPSAYMNKDTDFYTFTIVEQTEVTLAADNVPADLKVDLELYDSTQQSPPLDRTPYSQPAGTRAAFTIVLEPDTYFLKVSNGDSYARASGVNEPFTLIVQTTN